MSSWVSDVLCENLIRFDVRLIRLFCWSIKGSPQKSSRNFKTGCNWRVQEERKAHNERAKNHALARQIKWEMRNIPSLRFELQFSLPHSSVEPFSAFSFVRFLKTIRGHPRKFLHLERDFISDILCVYESEIFGWLFTKFNFLSRRWKRKSLIQLNVLRNCFFFLRWFRAKEKIFVSRWILFNSEDSQRLDFYSFCLFRLMLIHPTHVSDVNPFQDESSEQIEEKTANICYQTRLTRSHLCSLR